MEKIQSTTVCQEGVENGMKTVCTGVPDMSTSVPYFIRDPPIPSTLEGEENWDADNYETYTPWNIEYYEYEKALSNIDGIVNLVTDAGKGTHWTAYVKKNENATR
ncbi:hypothetical protein JTB14_012719 [Gonioctena quinquepunctata]|nr:hypothetical protein JTB14_012719 [Gonioctena quinquepunctata]